MHRIDTKTAQKDKFGAGKNGFTRGNPQTGTPATDLDDDYFDMLQEELCSVVEASGASLEKGRHDQLLTALRALLLSRKNPFGDIKSDGTVKTALENLGLSDVLHKGNFGVGSRLQGSAAGNSHVGGFMYEPYQANNLYPLSVALMQAAGPTSTEWAQLAVSYGGAFRAFLGRQTYNGNPEISELYHDQRKPSASDVGAQPLNATLTTLSGKDAAGLRSVLGLGTTATRNVGTGASQIPDMSSFLSGSTASAFWYKLPGGMVVMGGNASGIASGIAGNAVFFPVPFPNACSSVVVTLVSNGLYADTVSFNTYIPGTDRFNVYTNTSGKYTIYYMAFGS